MATTAQQAQLAKLYVGYFGRLMDNEGLQYWSSELDKRGIDAVANGIYAGAKGDDAAIKTLSNQAYVENVYNNVLNRAGDAAGVTYWTGELAKGVGRDIIVLRILDAVNNPGNEADKAILENTATVALEFANNWKEGVSADPQAIMDAITSDPKSIEAAHTLIVGTTTPVPPVVTNQTFNLDDSKKDYAADVKGGAGHDTYNITDFKTASIDGGEGSDTLNFVDYADGVTVDLRAGTGPDGLKVTWVENVIGTEGDDIITGSRDANVITMMGGADIIDAYLGDDLIIAADMDNVIASTLNAAGDAPGINGASGNDTLKILAADIDLDAVALATSSVEILKVGYDGVEEVAAAATVTVVGTDFKPKEEGIKEIHANTTKVYDRKGVEIFDEIVSSDENLDLTGVALYNFERVAVSDASGTITVGANTLTQLKEVVGVDDGAAVDPAATTTLELIGKDGDVFDMSAPKLINILTLNGPVSTAGDSGTNIKATLIMGQKQLDTLALVGDFSKASLQLKGQGIDMTGVDLTGMADVVPDPDADPVVLGDADESGTFKEIVFGANDTKSLLLSDVGVTTLAAGGTTIVGSEFEEDSLSIRVEAASVPGPVDMRGLITTSIESMDFEGADVVTLDNIVLHGAEGVNTEKGDVHNIAGDSGAGTAIWNGNAPLVDEDGVETLVALDLGGVKLRDIKTLGDADDLEQSCFLIDTGTQMGGVSELNGKVILDEAGTYDLTAIKTHTFSDASVEGSAGDDVVMGSATQGMSFVMGAGNDTVTGGAGDDTIAGEAGNDDLKGMKGDDDLQGGEGNDKLDGGEGDDTAIEGGAGVDSLTGGKGQDNFNFTTGDSGTTAATVDCINDFTYVGAAGITDNDDFINFTFLSDSALVGLESGIGVASNVGDKYADEATLADAAMAALEDLYADAVEAGSVTPDDAEAPAAGDYLAVIFQSGGNQYMAVDAYVSDAANVDFIVKLAGVNDATADLIADNIADILTITYAPVAIA